MEYNKKRKITVQHKKSGEIYEFESLREAASSGQMGYLHHDIIECYLLIRRNKDVSSIILFYFVCCF